MRNLILIQVRHQDPQELNRLWVEEEVVIYDETTVSKVVYRCPITNEIIHEETETMFLRKPNKADLLEFVPELEVSMSNQEIDKLELS